MNLDGQRAPGMVQPVPSAADHVPKKQTKVPMRLYDFMSRLPWPSTYVGRLFLLCFVGTHVPLVALVVFAVWQTGGVSLSALLVVLLATLVGTGLTLFGLLGMLEPVRRSAEALEAYARDRQMPTLPADRDDTAGRLMRSVRKTVETLDDKVGELSRLAYTDELTGCHNRRWMNEVAIPRFEAEVLAGGSPALLVIDLDGFKKVNDTHGHATGDDVLLVAADALRDALRKRDFVVRTGGDEFCIFLDQASEAEATDVAARTSEAIGKDVDSMGLDRRVTASVGIAVWKPSDKDFTELYRRADEMLYDIKRGRREQRQGL